MATCPPQMLLSEEPVEPPPHDLDVLPHMYSEEDAALLFPIITAAPIGPNVEDWRPGDDGASGDAAAYGEKKPRGFLRERRSDARASTATSRAAAVAAGPAAAGARRGLLRIA